MSEVKQKVDYYTDLHRAYEKMCEHIKLGWKIHTCTMGTYTAGYGSHEKILVVYEKEV